MSAKLRNTLLTCWPFESTTQITALYLNARLSPWRHGPAQAGNLTAAGDGLIGYLCDKRHASLGHGALVLFLELLAEVIDPGDSGAQELKEMVGALETIPAEPKRGRGGSR